MSRTRILLIVDDCHESDALRAMPYLVAVREASPNSEIVLLVGERAMAAVATYRELFDRVVPSRLYEKRGSSVWQRRLYRSVWLVRLALRLRPRYDLVLTFGWGTTMLNVLGVLVGRRRVGYPNKFPALLTSRLGRFDPSGDVFAQHAAVLEATGLGTARLPVSTRIFTSSDDAAARGVAAAAGLALDSRFAILHPGSDWACQEWLLQRWAELADRLAETRGLTIVFTGVAHEAERIAAIQSSMRAPSVSLVGRTTLTQLQALVSRAELCICVDSVVHELALGVGAPVVVLAGPSNTERAADADPRRVVVNRTPSDLRDAINACRKPRFVRGGCLDYRCPLSGLRDIKTEDVLAAVRAPALVDEVRPSQEVAL